MRRGPRGKLVVPREISKQPGKNLGRTPGGETALSEMLHLERRGERPAGCGAVSPSARFEIEGRLRDSGARPALRTRAGTYPRSIRNIWFCVLSKVLLVNKVLILESFRAE